MPDANVSQLSQFATAYLVPLLWRIGAAIALWVVGGYAIGWLLAALRRVLERQRLDASLVRYAASTAHVLLRVFLVVAILSVLGIETTSFAALIAAAGLAIGAAWAGLLANFAAGVFLLVLRPFRVGDRIAAAGVTGKVVEIGLFTTTIDTADNLRATVGNNKIFSDTIINYSTNPHRRVDLTAEVDHRVDPNDAIARLREALPRVPGVLAQPVPLVEILAFTPTGTQLAVRPCCRPDDYWSVYFATNKAIQETFAVANFPVAEQRYAVRAVT